MSTITAGTTTRSNDRLWSVSLAVAAVVSAGLALLGPVGGILAVAVLGLSIWRLRHTTSRPARTLLWVAIGVTAATLVLLTVVTFVIASFTAA